MREGAGPLDPPAAGETRLMPDTATVPPKRRAKTVPHPLSCLDTPEPLGARFTPTPPSTDKRPSL